MVKLDKPKKSIFNKPRLSTDLPSYCTTIELSPWLPY